MQHDFILLFLQFCNFQSLFRLPKSLWKSVLSEWFHSERTYFQRWRCHRNLNISNCFCFPNIAQPRPHPQWSFVIFIPTFSQNRGKCPKENHEAPRWRRAYHPKCLHAELPRILANFWGTKSLGTEKNWTHFFCKKSMAASSYKIAQTNHGKNNAHRSVKTLSNHEIWLLVAFESFYPNPNQKYAPMTLW